MIYLFVFNDDLWESCAGTVSAHKTRKGAEIALEHHKHQWIIDNDRKPNDKTEYWGIREIKLED